jgi:hypothetical protein
MVGRVGLECAVLLGVYLAGTASGLPAQSLTLTDVDVVQGDANTILRSQTVAIRDGVVASIEPGGVRTDSIASGLDGSGLYLVAGRFRLAGPSPGAGAADWQEEMLAQLSEGVTSLAISPSDGSLDRIRALIPPGHPRPRLVHADSSPSSVDRSWRPGDIKVGSDADLLLLEANPLVLPATEHRPVAVVVGGHLYTRDDLAAAARLLARRRRHDPYNGAPFLHASLDGAWPKTCVSMSLVDCFGPDPECAFLHVLFLRMRVYQDCGAPSVRESRESLARSLDRLARVAPQDDWIVGQRVYLALVDDRFEDAFQVSDDCESDVWWCQALRGYVAHRVDPASTSMAFDSVLLTAPAGTPAWGRPPLPGRSDRGVKCEWTDLTHLLEDAAVRAEYLRQPCGSRSPFEAGFWFLADPLWSAPGNSRLDEHRARNVLAKLRDDVLRAFSPGWGRKRHDHCVAQVDYQTLTSGTAAGVCWSSHRDLLAFGQFNSWRGVPYSQRDGTLIGPDGTLRNPDPGTSERRSGVSSALVSRRYSQLREGFLHGGYSFVPDARRIHAPETSTASDWALEWNEGHERMLTRETWFNLDHQVAVLRRGEDLRIVAASSFPTLLPSLDRLEGFLAMGRASDQHIEVAPATVQRETGVMRAGISLPDDAWIASVEAMAPDVRGRARLGAPAPEIVNGFGISRPVLMPPEFDPSKDDLLGAMLPSTRAPSGGSVGLYVELYGVAAGQTAEMSLTYDPGEPARSFLGRIAGALGFGGGDRGPVRIRWSEQLEDVTDGVARVFVTTDLGGLDGGDVTLSMSATVDGRAATSTTVLGPRR